MDYIRVNSKLSISKIIIHDKKEIFNKLNFNDVFTKLIFRNERHDEIEILFNDISFVKEDNKYTLNLEKFWTLGFDNLFIIKKNKNFKVKYNILYIEKIDGLFHNKIKLTKHKKEIADYYKLNFNISFDFIGITFDFHINKIYINGVEIEESRKYIKGKYIIELFFYEKIDINELYIYFISYERCNNFMNNINNYFQKNKFLDYKGDGEFICPISCEKSVNISKFPCCNQYISMNFLKEYIKELEKTNFECCFCRKKINYKKIKLYKKIE